MIFPPFVTLLDPAVISIAAVPDFGNAVIVFVAVVVFAVYASVSLSNFGERVNPPILRSDSSAFIYVLLLFAYDLKANRMQICNIQNDKMHCCPVRIRERIT